MSAATLSPLDEVLETLTAGRTVDLGGGELLRVVVAPDCDWHVADDADWYGALEPVTANTWQARNYYGGCDTRPDGFDGRARKVGRDRSWWWQPGEWFTDDTIEHFAHRLTELLEYGADLVTIEWCRGTDAYGAPVVAAWSALGGVTDTGDADVMRDVLTDLLADVSGQMADAPAVAQWERER